MIEEGSEQDGERVRGGGKGGGGGEKREEEKKSTPWLSGVESMKKQRVTINNPVGCSPERLHVCYEPNNDVIGPWK